jgi:hypothetical protein
VFKKTIAIALVTLMCSTTANAVPARDVAQGQRVTVSVQDKASGELLPLFSHRNDLYAPGVPGRAYNLVVANDTPNRVMAVLSVDGVNVITGNTASAGQSGYVLGPYQHLVLAGWRKSMAEVAEFYFTAQNASYAARTGRPQNVGVIGVAVFEEVPPPPQRVEMVVGSQADGAKALSAPEAKVGTGHGTRVQSEAQYASFHKASTEPAEVLTIYYDSPRNLVARGIMPVPVRRVPSAFPADSFVRDPR